jgi:hypothetical protein
MSLLLKRKWRSAAVVGMASALACDWTTKYFAGAAMMSHAKAAARIPTDADSHSLVHLSGIAQCIGLVVAAAAVVCWCISMYRQEPGSSFWVVLLFAIYSLLFFLLV